MTVTFQVGDREFGGAGNLDINFWVGGHGINGGGLRPGEGGRWGGTDGVRDKLYAGC
jgi:hypothetical protein